MRDMHVFDLYTVSDSRKPLHASDGMQITPDYTFDDAPQPNVVVVPAQNGESPKMMGWLRKTAASSDVVVSVCTGAYQLAEAGLLKGKRATTHHDAWQDFRNHFPDANLLGRTSGTACNRWFLYTWGVRMAAPSRRSHRAGKAIC
jgi:transcriptional regulator GlxA family with amidase domain